MGGNVEHNEGLADARRFGSYLRKLRESRKLSLDAVEEMASGFADRITKSHLSRIENGQAEPTFRRMYALSLIYGVPVTALAERFELDLKLDAVDGAVALDPDLEPFEQAYRLRLSGRYLEALRIYEGLLAAPDARDPTAVVRLRLHRVNCLIQLESYGVAKEEVESILDLPDLSDELTELALLYFAMACYRSGRHTVALLAVDRAETMAGRRSEPSRVSADIAALKGNLVFAVRRFDEAAAAYERADALYGALDLAFDRCRVRRNLATTLIATGDVAGARAILDEVIATAEAGGYDRQLAYAYSDLAAIAWREDDLKAAESYCLRSNVIARPREYISLVFRNCYYLWRIARQRGDVRGIRTNERTLRAYLGRVDEALTEADDYRSFLDGGAS